MEQRYRASLLDKIAYTALALTASHSLKQSTASSASSLLFHTFCSPLLSLATHLSLIHLHKPPSLSRCRCIVLPYFPSKAAARSFSHQHFSQVNPLTARFVRSVMQSVGCVSLALRWQVMQLTTDSSTEFHCSTPPSMARGAWVSDQEQRCHTIKYPAGVAAVW